MITQIEVLTGPPEGAHDVLSIDALAFLEMLHRRFNRVRLELRRPFEQQ